jgi:hypothetical protein
MALLAAPLFGDQYDDGRIRLVLDPQLGRFSLYYMTDLSQKTYEALFMAQDPRTTVLTVSYNDKFYRLGDSGEFTISEGGSPQRPALIFESPFLKVTEEFSFIVTQDSPVCTGIRINFRVENKGRRRAQTGLRFLLDTKLGESTSIPFVTDIRQVEEELLVDGKTGGDRYWVSGRPHELALMGSLAADVDRIPDRVHFANWKRLDEVPWALDLVPGRRFNNPPYSIRDSAVAYYYEPTRLGRGEALSWYLLLGVYDGQGFTAFQPSSGLPPGPGPAFAGAPASGLPRERAPNLNPAVIRSDYNALREIVDRINGYLESGSRMSDDELTSIEQDLARIRSRYAGSREPGEP